MMEGEIFRLVKANQNHSNARVAQQHTVEKKKQPEVDVAEEKKKRTNETM